MQKATFKSFESSAETSLRRMYFLEKTWANFCCLAQYYLLLLLLLSRRWKERKSTDSSIDSGKSSMQRFRKTTSKTTNSTSLFYLENKKFKYFFTLKITTFSVCILNPLWPYVKYNFFYWLNLRLFAKFDFFLPNRLTLKTMLNSAHQIKKFRIIHLHRERRN